MQTPLHEVDDSRPPVRCGDGALIGIGDEQVATVECEEVRSMMDKGEFLLAEDGAALVGCVYLEPRGECRYLGLLSVEPARRCSGLVRYLAHDVCGRSLPRSRSPR